MEIFTEVIVVKKYKFCDELWQIIKDYIGIYGIDLRIPNIMSLSNMQDIIVYNKMCFKNHSKYCIKKNLYVKFFYDNLRLQKKEDILTICDNVIKTYENSRFIVPLDLHIGEVVLIYAYAIWEREPDIGIVSKINKSSFTVKVPEMHSNGKYYDKVRIIKNNKYLRRDKANADQLRFFWNRFFREPIG
jgi:hypothetical protein